MLTTLIMSEFIIELLPGSPTLSKRATPYFLGQRTGRSMSFWVQGSNFSVPISTGAYVYLSVHPSFHPNLPGLGLQAPMQGIQSPEPGLQVLLLQHLISASRTQRLAL